MTRKPKVSRPFRTKPGLHGTLYLHEIVFRDSGEPDYPDGTYEHCTERIWAYDKYHAEEIFYSSPDAGEILSIHRVREKR